MARVGRVVGGTYLLDRVIGRGGMGTVYEATSLSTGAKVALKLIDAEFARDEQVVRRFAREAQAAGAVRSPNVVAVLDSGVESGRPYLVMELLRGEDLGARLAKERRIPLGESLAIVEGVLTGLAAAHQVGVTHRDLKPDNVFLSDPPGVEATSAEARNAPGPAQAPLVKVVDFGVSKVQKPQGGTVPLALTGKGTVLGTPLYMSPEQAQAATDLDGRADLYSLGAILFECLAGRPPHVGETYEQVLLATCMSDAPDVRSFAPGVPPPVAAFVAHALARKRDERFASAQDMLHALRVVRCELEDAEKNATLGLAQPPVAMPLLPVSPEMQRLPESAVTWPRRLALPATALVAMLVGMALTLWLVSRLGAAPGDEPRTPHPEAAPARETSQEGRAPRPQPE